MKKRNYIAYDYDHFRKFRWYPETDDIHIHEIGKIWSVFDKKLISGNIVPIKGTDMFCLGVISSIIADVIPIKLKYHDVTGFEIRSLRCLVRAEYTGTYYLDFICFTDDASYAQFVLLFKDNIDWNSTRVDLLENHG